MIDCVECECRLRVAHSNESQATRFQRGAGRLAIIGGNMENRMLQEIDLSNFRLGDIAEIQKAVKKSDRAKEIGKTLFVTLQLSELLA